MAIRITLQQTLDASNGKLTRHSIAKESGVRRATLHELVHGETKAVSFKTMDAILDAMNELNPDGNYDIADIFVYEREKDA